MGPDGINPRVLSELVEIFKKQLSIIFHQSWIARKVWDDWMLANMVSIHKKGQKAILGTCQLDLGPWKGYGKNQLE